MGRRDQQVKVHGFRVDTLEVERALLAYRGVRAVAVSPYRRENGSVWLVAWMVSERPGEDWRGLLRWRLPNHMIPAMFVEVESLPMTFSGKVDRQALVDSTRLLLRGNPESAAPVSETSRIVEVLVGEILEIDHVDMSMPFEMIGGYSLAAARLIIRIKHAFGVDVEADELFSDISLETLAARIDS
jgi:hypothetical protein